MNPYYSSNQQPMADASLSFPTMGQSPRQQRAARRQTQQMQSVYASQTQNKAQAPRQSLPSSSSLRNQAAVSYPVSELTFPAPAEPEDEVESAAEPDTQEAVQPSAAQELPTKIPPGLHWRKRAALKNALAGLPPLKKGRVARACDVCRKKRRELCSGYKPCQHCTAKGDECTYDMPYKKGRPITPPPPPENDPTARWTSLDAAQHEAAEHRHVVEGPNFGLSPHAASRRTCDLCRALRRACDGKTPQCGRCQSRKLKCTWKDIRKGVRSGRDAVPPPDEVQPRAEMNDDIQALHLDRRYADLELAPLSFLSNAWRRMAEAQHELRLKGYTAQARSDPRAVSTGDQPFGAFTVAEGQELTQEQWQEMQEQYWASTNGIYRFLHKPTTDVCLSKVFGNLCNDKLELWHNVGHARAACAVMICALGSQFRDQSVRSRWVRSTNFEPDEWCWQLAYGDHLFNEAIKLTDAEVGAPKLESVQARLLQDLYLLSTFRMTQAWYTFGNTLRMITTLGLHRRLGGNRGLPASVTTTPDYGKIECEKRTFWTAYCIDKYLSVMLGRPAQLNDDEIDQDFPDPVNDEDMVAKGPFRPNQCEGYIEPLIFLSRMTKIMHSAVRQIYTFRNIPFAERVESTRKAVQDVTEWEGDLPYMFKHFMPKMLQPIYRRQAHTLRLTRYFTLLLAYRPYLVTIPYPRDMSGTVEAMLKKREHDRRIRDVAQYAQVVLGEALTIARDLSREKFRNMWLVHHIVFAALCVAALLPYVRAHQKAFGDPLVHTKRGHFKIDMKLEKAADRAMKAFKATASVFAPARKYVVIVEELKREVWRRLGKDPDVEEARAREQQQATASGSANGSANENQRASQNANNAQRNEDADDNNDDEDDEDEDAENEDEEPTSPDIRQLEEQLRTELEEEHSRSANMDRTTSNEDNVGSGSSTRNQQQRAATDETFQAETWASWGFKDWLDLDSAAFGPIGDFEPRVEPPPPPPAPAPAPAASTAAVSETSAPTPSAAPAPASTAAPNPVPPAGSASGPVSASGSTVISGGPQASAPPVRPVQATTSAPAPSAAAGPQSQFLFWLPPGKK